VVKKLSRASLYPDEGRTAPARMVKKLGRALLGPTKAEQRWSLAGNGGNEGAMLW
jgi:hypothetical protein